MTLEPQDDNRDGVAIKLRASVYYKEVMNNAF